MSRGAQATATVNEMLSRYPSIKKFLGELICQRLRLGDIEGSALISEMLDDDPCGKYGSTEKLAKLEEALQRGEKACNKFTHIFSGHGLPGDPTQADGKILDVLAEVKTVEYLDSNAFNGIEHIPVTPKTKTPDFLATRCEERYLVETTRVGLPQPQHKKTRPSAHHELGHGSSITFLDNKGAGNAYLATLRAAAQRECKQLADFITSGSYPFKGIVVLTLGRDFFVSKHARRDFFLPSTRAQALQQVWKDLSSMDGYAFLSHIVLIANPNSTVTCPELQ